MPISTSRAWALPSRARSGRGIATPSGTNGEITVLTSANDFADNLVAIKNGLAERARQLTAEADRLQRFGSARSGRPDQGASRGGCGLSRPRRPAEGRGGARLQAAEPARRHQRRPRQDHQALRHRHHGRGAAAAQVGEPMPNPASGRSSPTRRPRAIARRPTRRSRSSSASRQLGAVERAASTGCSSSPATAASRSLPASAARSWAAR